MLTKRGKELDVLGQVNVEGRPHFIVKLKSPTYHVSGIMYKYVLLPESQVDFPNGFENIEIVPKETTGETNEQKINLPDDKKDDKAER